MARRFDRTNQRFPVDLVWESETANFEKPASVVDISEGGLRIQTGPRLLPGQILRVFLEGEPNPSARCRVVWAQTHGSALPSEAGLEILGGVPWPPTPHVLSHAA